MAFELPRFDFYPADWLASAAVRRMSRAARGSYIDLLAIQWRHGSIPEDGPEVARVLGVHRTEVEEWLQEEWPLLAEKFPVGPDGSRRNPRLERERAAALRRKEEASVHGKKGNATRWGSGGDRNPIATQRSGGDRYSPSPSPIEEHSPSESGAAAPPAKKTRAQSSSLHQRAIDFWCRRYQDTQGDKYEVQAKDAAAVKRMLARHTPQELAERAEKLLGCEDPFHAGHRTLAWLESRWNEIGQLERAHSLRLEGTGSKVVREAAREVASGHLPGVLDFLNQPAQQERQLEGGK